MLKKLCQAKVGKMPCPDELKEPAGATAVQRLPRLPQLLEFKSGTRKMAQQTKKKKTMLKKENICVEMAWE